MALRLPRPNSELLIPDLNQALKLAREHNSSLYENLSREEMTAYGRVINFCRERARQMAHQHLAQTRDRLTASPQALTRTLRNDNDALIELERRFFFSIFPQELTTRLVAGSKRFIISKAREYNAMGMLCELCDLVGAGIVGVLEAIRLYDHEMGNSILTYANDWIKEYVKREITERSYRSYARLPEYLSVLKFQVSEFMEKFRLEHGRLPTDKEILKQKFDVNGKKLTTPKLRLLHKFVHIAEPERVEEITNADEDQVPNRENLLALTSQDGSPEDRLIAREELKERLRQLEEDYRLIAEAVIGATITICLKTAVRDRRKRLEAIADERIFGRNDDHNHPTLKEIGNRFSIERERVRQEEEKLLHLTSRVTGFSVAKIRRTCLQMNRLREIQTTSN